MVCLVIQGVCARRSSNARQHSGSARVHMYTYDSGLPREMCACRARVRCRTRPPGKFGWLQPRLRDAARIGGDGFSVGVGTLWHGCGIAFDRAPCAHFSAAQLCAFAALDSEASHGRLVRGNRVGGAWSSLCGSTAMSCCCTLGHGDTWCRVVAKDALTTLRTRVN